ncbi:hypothetical protein [Lederbergia galactosidilytica]|uniref:Uncharacterized protein n=1 Tax=Lederbergia galactosidilytica TaxID=217031 RepID=A0A0Q9Y9W7_9BACI|nr:hypothetical protein [Lederbergia galactosidilytica]KRG12648.1 hypothetical protein ACA29_10640 [Lederbergia galactosidilytica]KRG12996.1 hypothetical protein ACA30_16965 [Virgibacillus soli]OAK70111.1 hypothetical protein ABB05_13120 [Lederbergia galactosidilytica]
MATLSNNTLFQGFIEEAQQEMSEDKVYFWVQVFEAYFRENEILTYNDITTAIYNGTPEKLEQLQENWSKLMEHQTQWDLEPEMNEKFRKIDDHFLLATTQRSFILDNVESLKSQLDQKSNELDILTQELEEARKTVDELKDIKTRIYTEFVAILGIFTAVVLGAFGSLQIIGSVFTNIKDVPTGKLLVFSSLTSIGVTILLFLLMKWISYIVQRDSNSKWGSSFKENIFLVMGLSVMLYIMIVGFFLYNSEPKNFIMQLFSEGVWGLIIFIIISLITVVFLIYCLVQIKKK